MKIRTQAVHTGVNIDKTFNSVITPINPTSTFISTRRQKGDDYTRSGARNPRSREAKNPAEGGVDCSVTATGMAAITAAMFFLKAGDHIITGDDIYGGVSRSFNAVLKPMG